ncbi:MAG: folate-binding protein [Wolbachia endosymbiont of Fragariocoptes setiger]|nr:folate-binding protein [Wolbachia endosymbiont of Fragariocoptes setiger]
MSYILLPNRSVIALFGPDIKNFLQNIITNDIYKLNNQKAIYSLLLTPQGRYLYDFFLVEHGKYILLECESIYLQELIKKINLLKTYLKVEVKNISKLYKVSVILQTSESKIDFPDNYITFQDPRHVSLGTRIIYKGDIKTAPRDSTEYEITRIRNLIPDGIKDMIQNSSFPLQYLIDRANGIDFHKGCYIGQEVVNRMKRQTKLKRQLYFVHGDNILPDVRTKIIDGEENIGELCSSIHNIGLALLDNEKSHSNLYVGKVKISV